MPDLSTASLTRWSVVTTTLVAILLLLLGLPAPGAANPRPAPRVSELVRFADPSCAGQCGSGSAIGPDGALYVTDGPGGRLLRIDRHTGAIQTLTAGLPRILPAVGLGGAVDVAFRGSTPYVLVTLVGPAFGQPDVVAGLYRVRSDGSVGVVADIGAWSTAHPPTTDFYVSSGFQYALTPYGGGFLVSDGHLNRVLRVDLTGRIREVRAFDNIVPTGVDTDGRRVYLGLAGPVPHRPEDGQVITWSAHQPRSRVLASGAPLVVGVEVTADHRVWVLSQGVWDHPDVPENAGLPASPNTGSLLRVDHLGRLVTVVGGLDRPTSVEVVGEKAYVITLTGTVLRVRVGQSHPTGGRVPI